MRAIHVGIYRTEPDDFFKTRYWTTCARCGHRWTYSLARPPHETCEECRLTDPDWGLVPFDQLPVSDSNVCAFDEEFVSRANLRRREKRARQRANREETP